MEKISPKNMFLTSKDLRIGNYVNYENTTHVVSELHQDKVLHYWLNSDNDGYVTKYTQILSIPISVHELDALGFLYDEEKIASVNGFYYKDSSIFLIKEEDDFYLASENRGKYVVINSIDFIHELQNVFYDIDKITLSFK